MARKVSPRRSCSTPSARWSSSSRPAPQLRPRCASARRRGRARTTRAAAMRAEIAYYRAHLDEARDAGRARPTCAGAARRRAGASWARRCRWPTSLDALLAALRFRAYPEAPAALGRLRAGGVRLVVVSNWDVSLHDVLETRPARAGRRRRHLGRGRRRPSPTRRSSAPRSSAWGRAAAEALHVGDSVEPDVAGARAAGWSRCSSRATARRRPPACASSPRSTGSLLT